MKWSKYFLPTLREDPKDAEAISHKLMVRAGLIRRLGSGAYSYLPFGLRALQKAAAIVREEMNRVGAQELLLPVLQPVDLWKTTGRYAALGDVLIKFKDRTGKELALGPTHEEVVTDLMKEIRSPRQLPVTVYQIQTKFRDEPRPRSGVIRSKEFLMKDAYSFDVDMAGLSRSYKTMYGAYERIFRRCGVAAIACEADPGIMGGDTSHEFMAPAESGEDLVVRCESCGYAANLEAAKSAPLPAKPAEPPKPIELVKTPGAHTVEQVSTLLKVTPDRLIKTLIYDVDPSTSLGIAPSGESSGRGKEHVAVLVRGDHEVNEAKLARALGTGQLRLSGAQTIERLSGAPVGFAGPVKLNGVKLVADRDAMGMANAVTGANQAEAHLINVNPGRDFTPAVVADLRRVAASDRCASCQGALTFVKSIESGHVFQLGTKYSQALGAVFQEPGGSLKPMIMGCYGIGVNRIVAAAIEQHHDAQGIVWPASLAPFHAVISVMEADNPEQQRVGQEVSDALTQAGFEVLLDDREQSPGSKFKDADLIGIPVQIVIGKTWQSQQRLEVGWRATKEKSQVKQEELVATVRKLLALDKTSSSS